jgi:hypothetical protein
MRPPKPRPKALAEGIKVLLHAAAYKHVPLVEANVCVGLANNIFGTSSALDGALWQRAGLIGFGGAVVSRANRERRPGHGDPPRDHPLFHDHS